MLRTLATLATLYAGSVAAQPRTRDHGEWLVGARAGASFPQLFSSLPSSWLCDVAVGWAPPVWKHRLALVVDADLSAPDQSGTRATSRVMGGGLAWRVQVRTVSAGVSLALRAPLGRVTLEVAAGPRLVYLDTIVDGANDAGRLELTREQSTHAGLGALGGVGVRLGAGVLSLEVPLVWAPATQRALGHFNAGWLAVVAGYTVVF